MSNIQTFYREVKSKLHLRYIIAVVLLIITAIVTFGAFSKDLYSKKLYTADIPLVIGSWHGRENPITERTYGILETKDVIVREYTNVSGGQVGLAVVYSKENVRVVHAPDICLSGWGSSICEKATEVVSFGPTQNAVFNNYTVESGSEKQSIFFLYKCGSKVTPNPLKMQFDFVINKALRRPHSAALIRFSTHAVKGDLESATNRIKQFAQDAMPILLRCLP